ncbi:MAG: branched-chain amino acid ABC transporter permease [Pseudomonadota bacterium]
MREWQVNLALVAILAGFVGYGVMADEPFLVTLATRIVIFAIAAAGLNLALGYGGLVSFGHAAFFGLGGYVCGILASHAQDYTPIFEEPFLIEGTNQMLTIWPLAILVAAAAAVVIGALSLRTSGVYFIMITLAFAQMIFYFAISWPAYGGEDGLSIYVRNEFPGMDQYAPMGLFQVSAGVLAIVLLLVWRITNARLGLALQAARQNAGRVSAVGIRPFGVRLTVFTISAAITGWAGALYVDLNKFVSPAMLSWETSGEIMIIVILGGVGRLFGPLAGAMLFILLEHYLGGVFEFWKILLGLALLAVVLFARGGVIGLLVREPRHG